MRTRNSPVVVLALALAMTSALPAQAAPRSLNPAEPQRLLSQLVSFLGKMPGRMVSVWEKEGSTVDPFGRGGTTPPAQGNGAVGPGPGDESLDK